MQAHQERRLAGPPHQAVAWTHLQGPDESELGQVLRHYDISWSTSAETYRATFDRYPEFYYVRFYGFAASDPTDLMIAVPVHVVVKSKVVISWCPRPVTAVDSVARKVDAHPDLIHNAHTLIFYLLDEIVEDTFPVLDVFNDRLAIIEHDVFAPGPRQRAIQQGIFRLKREILTLRHIVASERDVSYQLVRYWDTIDDKSESREWTFQLYDHVIRLFESADIYRELANSVLDIYLGSVSNRLNEIVKKLTLVTVLFVPASLVAALYGMNFDYLPGQHHPWGFFLVVGGVFLISLTLLAIFRQRRWL